MPASESPVLRFGVFELDLKNGELRKAGVLVKLQPQPFKVLALLVSRAGEVVTREELQQQVWGSDTFVDFERGLNFCIKQIRDALADDADTPRYVETLPRRGYRFLVAVEGSEPEPGPPEPPPAPGRCLDWRVALALALGLAVAAYFGWPRLWRWLHPPQKVMLLVLPFDNLGGDTKEDYFSDGLTEEMITQLGRLDPDRLGVIARNTTMLYKKTNKSIEQIGRETHTEYILEGSVRRAGDHVRISANLIQVSDQTHLWAENYERSLEDVLQIQSDVARHIADSLALELLPAEQARLSGPRPVNPEAYDAYLKGRFYWNKRHPEALQRDLDFFREAIAKDPKFALAYTGVADTYNLLGSTPYDVLPPHEAMPKAKAAARQALALDDTLAEAHNALAHTKLYYDWDWAAAEQEFRRALELNPSYAPAHQWYAEYLWMAGRPEEALAHIRRALELDPDSLVIKLAIGRHYYYTRQYEQALAQFNEAAEMEPGFFLAHFDLGVTYSQLGRHPEAIAEFQKAVQLFPNSPLCLAGLGYAYAVAGRKADALHVLQQLEQMAHQRYVPPLYVAGIYAGLGDKDRAFQWLEKAYQERSAYLIHLQIEPIFDNLHGDPRFPDLLRRLNLPPPSSS